MTATAQIEYTDYKDKKVVLERVTDDGVVEVEGTVLGAMPGKGISFREKGKTNVELILDHEIEGISTAEGSEAKVKARRLDFIALDKIKRHLVDRHGVTLTQVNSMTAEEAFQVHEDYDHSDLGHFHAAAPKKD